MTSYTTTPKTIASVWKALSTAPGKARDPMATWRKAAEQGWLYDIDLKDALWLAEPRLEQHDLEPAAFAALLEVPDRWVFSRPANRFDEPSGLRALAAADVAALLILLERLGFAVDAEPLCSLLRPQLADRALLTESELDVLFHHKSVFRTPPLTLAAPDGDYSRMTTSKLRTHHGYRAESTMGGDGAALWLTVKAPKFRTRPDPVLSECAECGMSFMKGLPSDDKEHRKLHRLRRKSTHPEPHLRFSREMTRDPLGAPWVDESSAAWKHELMYRRAFAFKREAGHDFAQWGLNPWDNQGAVGYLFSDSEGRVVGAAGFRPQEGERPWRLDFVWLAPAHRRQGLLTRQWPGFRQRFGDFDVEHPLSEEMKAFLRKRGDARLIYGEEAIK